MNALRIICGMLCTLLAILVITAVSSFAFIVVGFSWDDPLPADCGLVFGAAISGQNTATPAIVRRVEGAAELWKDGKLKLLILSGGKGDAWRLSEAQVMRQQAIRSGVDGRAILIEDEAKSTKENLLNSRKIVDEHCESVVAISDQYHLARIRLLAKKTGWGNIRTYGAPERPERGEWWSVLRELAGYLYYAFGADQFLQLDRYDDVPPLAETGSGAVRP